MNVKNSYKVFFLVKKKEKKIEQFVIELEKTKV